MTPAVAPGARVLVTGGSGFIGRRLVERLVNAGADVTVTTSRPVSDVTVPGATIVSVNLTNADATLELFSQIAPSYVFHLASQVTSSPARSLVKSTLEANLMSTVHLLDAAAATGTLRRFVHAGTLEVPVGDIAPNSPYAAAKAAAAGYVRLYDRCYGVPSSVARLFMVYGPGAQPRSRLVPYVIGCLTRGEAPQLASGTRLVDWVYIDDAVEGLWRVAFDDRARGQTVDIGTGVLTTVREVAQRLDTIMGTGVMTEIRDTEPNRDSPGQSEVQRRADVESTAALIGWIPTISLDDGLLITVAATRTPSV